MSENAAAAGWWQTLLNMNELKNSPQCMDDAVAIVGMSARFPGADGIHQYWENLRGGIESITQFSDKDLSAHGVSEATLRDPSYVKAGGIIADIAQFDAGFFNYSPREAEIMDPQHRVFLECVWEALESASCDPERFSGSIGLYAAVSHSAYLMKNLLTSDRAEKLDIFSTLLSNDKDSLATQAAYKLNLKGPCYSVQSFCSSSLVALHLAKQSLLERECDLALAGGVSIRVPQVSGYFFKQEGILSADGHCRAFDAHASGTVFGSGAGVVALKRYEDAIEAGDFIHSVILGSAVNNDGSGKAGYTTPSVTGQRDVILAALADAGVHPEEIGYLEAHGTGTPLGDPVEVTALVEAFRTYTSKRGFCALGSVKSNIGHVDVASGIASCIKAASLLRHGEIPPTAAYSKPNPGIDLASSPFYINNKLRPWAVSDGRPRRAGVSSFGLGGTNAHVVLQEPPLRISSSVSQRPQLLVLSAKTPKALADAAAILARHIGAHPDMPLADVAHTLRVGRQRFGHRWFGVCRDREDAMAVLAAPIPKTQSEDGKKQRPVAFLFGGSFTEISGVAPKLYDNEPVFRAAFDSCIRYYNSGVGGEEQLSVPDAMHASFGALTASRAYVMRFATEYGLAELWASWGVIPAAMLGHGIGELVAACRATVFSLADAIRIATRRGLLLRQDQFCEQVNVALDEPAAGKFTNDAIRLVAVNGEGFCTLAGDTTSIAALMKRLAGEGVSILRPSPRGLIPLLRAGVTEEQLGQVCVGIAFQSPRQSIVSSVTGDWLQEFEATDPAYWARQFTVPARFENAVDRLFSRPGLCILEVGTGCDLAAIALAHRAGRPTAPVRSWMKVGHAVELASLYLLETLGWLWQQGVNVDWVGLNKDERRLLVPLPSYPFERQHYWVQAGKGRIAAFGRTGRSDDKVPASEWFYTPSWKRSGQLGGEDRWLVVPRASWLILCEPAGPGADVGRRLEQNGEHVVWVYPKGAAAERPGVFHVNLSDPKDYARTWNAVENSGVRVGHVVHFLRPAVDVEAENAWRREFHSVLQLARTVGAGAGDREVRFSVVVQRTCAVHRGEPMLPAAALVLGLLSVIPQEYSRLRCKLIDIDAFAPIQRVWPDPVGRVTAELRSDSTERRVAYRQGTRWIEHFEPIPRPVPSAQLKSGSTVWITGGLGNVGLAIAAHLAQKFQLRIVLSGRSVVPSREGWDSYIAAHDASDTLASRLIRVRAVEQAGSEVLVVTADVANVEEMESAMKQIKARFGRVDLVLHAAGILGAGTSALLAETGIAQCDAVFRPKVVGADVLTHVLRLEREVSVILVSSLSAIIGGIGNGAYASANAYMDAVAWNHDGINGNRWCSVNSDTWLFDDANLVHGMSSALGAEALVAVLETAEPQVLVSTVPFGERMRQAYAKVVDPAIDKNNLPTAKHPRPALSSAYASPRTDAEFKICGMWEELLGIESIGINDSFVELGGHSLLAVEFLSRLELAFGARLPLHVLLESQTIGRIAQELGLRLWSIENAAVSVDLAPREHIEL